MISVPGDTSPLYPSPLFCLHCFHHALFCIGCLGPHNICWLPIWNPNHFPTISWWIFLSPRFACFSHCCWYCAEGLHSTHYKSLHFIAWDHWDWGAWFYALPHPHYFIFLSSKLHTLLTPPYSSSSQGHVEYYYTPCWQSPAFFCPISKWHHLAVPSFLWVTDHTN